MVEYCWVVALYWLNLYMAVSTIRILLEMFIGTIYYSSSSVKSDISGISYKAWTVRKDRRDFWQLIYWRARVSKPVFFIALWSCGKWQQWIYGRVFKESQNFELLLDRTQGNESQNQSKYIPCVIATFSFLLFQFRNLGCLYHCPKHGPFIFSLR